MTEAELQELERLVTRLAEREGHHRRDYARDRLVNAAPALIAAARERPLAELTRLRAEFAAQAEECVRLRLLAKRLRNFLGWEYPKGGEDELEDELEAIDAEMVREGLRT